MLKLISLVLGTILLTACRGQMITNDSLDASISCTHQACSLPHVDDTVSDTVGEENWQFVITGAGWERLSTAPREDIKLSMYNRQLNSLLFFVKESTDKDLPDYVMASLIEFQQAGSKVEEVQSATVDNNQAVSITLSKDGATMWLWMTVKDNFAYTLSCAASSKPEAGTASLDYCSSVARTIQIK